MDELEFYRRHSALTDPGDRRHVLAGLPSDLGGMLQVIGGAVIHRDETWRWGFALTGERRDEANTRSVAAILDHLGTLDARPPEERFAGTCRDFTALLVAMLREAGVPARARAGFAGYFAEDFFDDHWVAELWDGTWRLVDAQLGSVPKGTYGERHVDALDVSRDGFLVGGQAWRECRAGRRDPGQFGVRAAGLSRDPGQFGVRAAGLTGMWEIQGNLVRDLASLNRVETLPWDNWGLIPVHYDSLPPADLDLLDRVAVVSAAGGPPDAAVEAYGWDPRLPVPDEALAARSAGLASWG